MSHLGHLSLLRSLPWMAFARQGFNIWVNSRKRRYLCVVSASIGLLLLSGHPQIALYSLFLISPYFVFARHAEIRVILSGLLALGLGIGLGAVQIIPGVHMLLFTQEYLPRMADTYEFFLSHSFHPAYLFTFLFPRARTGTYAEMVRYIGIAPLLLSCFGLFLVQDDERSRTKRFFILWLIVALLLSCGRFVPFLPRWLFAVPIYGSISRVPSRHLLELCFSLALLAALGLDGVIRRSKIRKPKLPILLGLMLALPGWIVFALLSPFSTEIPPLSWSTRTPKVIIQPIVLLLLSISLLVAIWRTEKHRKLLVLLLVAITIAELVDFGFPIYARGLVSPSFYEAPPTVVTMLQKSLSEGPFRVISFAATGDDKELLAPNYNAAYGIESVIGYDTHAFMLRQFSQAFAGLIPSWGDVTPRAVEQRRFRALLDLLGVKYLLIRTEKTEHLARYYKRMGSINGVDIYLNEQAHPRLFPLVFPERPDRVMQSFGGQIALVDYSLEKIPLGDSYQYVLVTWWACQSSISKDYTLYIHYLDNLGSIIGRAFTKSAR